MEINCKKENDNLDTKNDLFIIPIEYESDHNKPPESDTCLHFAETEATMYKNGSKIWCLELPKNFTLAKEASKSLMHYQTIASPAGDRYMALFTSYKSMTSIFGSKIQRIGVISYETAKEFCLNEGFSGIVVAPGVLNKIIPKEEI